MQASTIQSDVFINRLPKFTELNVGVLLLSIYILLEFGSFQGLYGVIRSLKIPYIIAVATLGYLLFLIVTGECSFKGGVTKSLFILFSFIIIYSLVSTRTRSVLPDILKGFLMYYVNYLVFVSKVKTKAQFVFLLDVLLVSVAFSSYHACRQGGLIWGSRWLNDENQMALLVSMVMPFAFLLFMLHKSKIKKLFYLCCMVIYLLVVVISHSRGSTLSMGLGIILCFLVVKNKLRNFLGIIILVSVSLYYAPPVFFQEMSTLQQGTKESTANDRLYLWGIAMDMLKDHPVLGVGPANYPYYFFDYEQGVRYTHGGRVAHSTPIEYLAETGIVGMIILLLLQVQLYRNWRITVNASGSDPTVGGVMLYSDIRLLGHAALFSQLVFHFGSLFLSLFIFPFYWIIIPFSEAWKNIALDSNRTGDS